MSNDIAFLFVTGMCFCVFCLSGFCFYAALVLWKACDFHNAGYCWGEAVLQAMEYFY